MANTMFKGFSSVGKSRPFTEITDKDLIKIDILNHFNTRMGGRAMRPSFGSRLWDFVFEPFDALTRDAIIEDATNVVRADMRVEILNINVQEYEYGISIAFQLKYVIFNSIEDFVVGFDRRTMMAQEIIL